MCSSTGGIFNSMVYRLQRFSLNTRRCGWKACQVLRCRCVLALLPRRKATHRVECRLVPSTHLSSSVSGGRIVNPYVISVRKSMTRFFISLVVVCSAHNTKVHRVPPKTIPNHFKARVPQADILFLTDIYPGYVRVRYVRVHPDQPDNSIQKICIDSSEQSNVTLNRRCCALRNNRPDPFLRRDK